MHCLESNYPETHLWILSYESSWDFPIRKARGSSPNHFILKIRRILMQDFLVSYSIRFGLGQKVCIHGGSHCLFSTVGFISFLLGYQEPCVQAAYVKIIWVWWVGQTPQIQWVFSTTSYSWFLIYFYMRSQSHIFLFSLHLTYSFLFFICESTVGSSPNLLYTYNLCRGFDPRAENLASGMKCLFHEWTAQHYNISLWPTKFRYTVFPETGFKSHTCESGIFPNLCHSDFVMKE